MTCAPTVLDLLGFDRASTDAERVAVLGPLLAFARRHHDDALVRTLEAACPKTDPYQPFAPWASQYRDGFSIEADEERGVYMDQQTRYQEEFWEALSDAERTLRVQTPDMGFSDGRRDAISLNGA